MGSKVQAKLTFGSETNAGDRENERESIPIELWRKKGLEIE